MYAQTLFNLLFSLHAVTLDIYVLFLQSISANCRYCVYCPSLRLHCGWYSDSYHHLCVRCQERQWVKQEE